MISITTLFVNACMRGSESRTLKLCREYLSKTNDVIEVDLSKLPLKSFDAQMVDYRTKKQSAKQWNDPIFDLSRQFASADNIIIGAPYWDLSFPSALKVYLEHISVCNIVFRYTDEGQYVGLCKAKSLTYITSCGGFIEGANYGYEYICGIAKMFGIPETHFIAAEGLDIVGIDVEAQMEKAREQIRALN